MRLSRRALLIGGGAFGAAGLAGAAWAQRPQALSEPTPIAVQATRIDSLDTGAPDQRRFGALAFRSGLDLQSSVDAFGGLSGLVRSADGRELVSVTDSAHWFTARVVAENGRLTGLADTLLAPMLDADGRPLRRTRYYDTEGLTIAGGTAYVSVERNPALLRFDWAKDGVQARGRVIAPPPDARDLPRNQGLEAIGVAPARSPLAGALVAVAERAEEGERAPTRGYILTGSRRGSFQLARSDDFDITDLAFLPSGEVLVLERRFSLLRGVAARLRRLAPDAIRPGALADGPVIFETAATHRIDNMEGLALHQEGGETVVTMVSDNNFSTLQRTILLEFVLVA
ncbi:MAG TPA: esterase-like activity of phytase family protein [Microvirga sp.]|nr:esterase-like activity of phytase family protein [Microvirga sp.]